MTDRAFFYVDGIPTKGMWIDLEDVADFDEVKEQLVEGGFITEDYDGDILVADIEGAIATQCYTSAHDYFDMTLYKSIMDDVDSGGLDEGAVAAYIDMQGITYWSITDFEDSYQGEADSEVAFAEQLLEDCGDLDAIPESLRYYFDYEKYARDLFITDFYLTNGYVFRRN